MVEPNDDDEIIRVADAMNARRQERIELEAAESKATDATTLGAAKRRLEEIAALDFADDRALIDLQPGTARAWLAKAGAMIARLTMLNASAVLADVGASLLAREIAAIVEAERRGRPEPS